MELMRRRVKSEGIIFVGFAIPMFEYCFIKFQTKVVERVRKRVEEKKYKDNVHLVVTERGEGDWSACVLVTAPFVGVFNLLVPPA